MPKILIPKGFMPIALSEIGQNKSVAYYNPKSRMFMFTLNSSRVLGPVSVDEMPALLHVANDISSMKGHYGPITLPPGIDA